MGYNSRTLLRVNCALFRYIYTQRSPICTPDIAAARPIWQLDNKIPLLFELLDERAKARQTFRTIFGKSLNASED